MNKIFNIINNFFSSKYANKNAIGGNLLSLILYKLAYPTARGFARFSIKPNVVTWLSVLFSVLAVFFLIRENGRSFFVVFWLLSLHLDFCDGTLARMTNNISKSAFRLDHMTDLIKIYLVFLGVGICYNNFITWILISVSVFCFMFSENVHYLIDYYIKRATENNIQLSNTTILDSKWIKKTGLFRFGFLTVILRNIYSVFFSISGHTLIFFCIFSFGATYSNAFLIYFICVCIYFIIRTVIALSAIKR